MKLILDIETKPNEKLVDIWKNKLSVPKTYKKPDVIKRWYGIQLKDAHKKMSVDTDYLEIKYIGIKEVGKEARIVDINELREILDTNMVHLITYNGKNFDVPAIIKTGIKEGIKFPYQWLREAQKRHSDNHTDLFDLINLYGQYKSLDELLQIYCGISKTPIDFQCCTDEELKKHCLEDLVNTEKLYKKFSVLL